ncbi:MAG: hypothetical protein AAF743_11270, partial [Planctomycetota bacterium]
MSHEVSPTSTVPASHNRLRQAISRAARVTLGGLRAPDPTVEHRRGPRAQVVAETLEERRLLVTIGQGDVFEYNGTDDVAIRVTASGDNTASLVAASTDEFGAARLNDLSGTIDGPSGQREILGGLGVRGVLTVGQANNPDIPLQFAPPSFMDIIADGDADPDNYDSSGVGPDGVPNTGDDFRDAGPDGIFFTPDDIFGPRQLINSPREDLEIGGIAASPSGATYVVYDNPLAVGDDEVSQLYIGAVDRGTGQTFLLGPSPTATAPFSEGEYGFRGRLAAALNARLNEDGDPAPQFIAADAEISVIGADFDPSDANSLYFAATVTVVRFIDGDFTDVDVPFLFQYDLTAETLVALPGEFNAFGGGAPVRIDGIAFNDDDNPATQNSLFVFGEVADTFTAGDQTADTTRTGFWSVNPNDTDGYFVNDVTAVANPETSPNVGGGGDIELVDELVALEIIPGEPQFIFGVTTDNVLLRIRTGINDVPGAVENGVARSAEFGPLEDPDGNATVFGFDIGAPRGAAIGDITWNASAVNPFFQERFDADPNNDSQRGAFFGTDFGTDELLTIDNRQRFAQNALYFIALTGEDDESVFTIAEFDPDDDQGPVVRQITPYDGNAGPFDAINAVTGAPISVSPAGGTGNVFLGLTRPVGDLDNVPLQAIDRETLDIFVQPEVDLGGAPFINPGVYGTGTFGRIF